jgi:hypothetical protein
MSSHASSSGPTESPVASRATGTHLVIRGRLLAHWVQIPADRRGMTVGVAGTSCPQGSS